MAGRGEATAQPRRGGARAGRGARGRRSHAERTAATRARILAAVLESIADVGIQRATASEITRRAGLTWGAVQHHFGDKDALLAALLEESFRRFEERLAPIPGDAPLETRAALFVERAWEHFGHADYRASFEILLHDLGRDDRGERPTWQDRMSRAWDAVWRRLFADAPLARARQRVLQHYTISVLSGLATTLMLEGRRATVRPGELALLVDTLVRELTRREA